MKELYISPFLLLLIYGLVGLALQVIMALPFNYIPCKLSFCSEGVVETYIPTFRAVIRSSVLIGYLFAYSISVAVYMLFLLIVNDAFNPTQVALRKELKMCSGGLWVWLTMVLIIISFLQ